MGFIIENKKGGYISSLHNKFTVTGNLAKAQIFSTQTKANNVINSLPRTIRNTEFYVSYIDNKGNISEVKPEKTFVVTNTFSGTSEKITKIKNIISELCDCGADICVKELSLKERLSEIEKELVDIDHRIEFYPLSAYDGYKMSKMRKDRLEERRVIKDSLREISIIKDIKGDEAFKRLKDMEIKKYTPRALVDIFEEKENVKRRRGKGHEIYDKKSI